MALVLDTGALVAIDRGDRRVAALIEATRRRGDAVRTSSGCVAQAWRSGGPRQALLARTLKGIDESPLDPRASRSIGALCMKAGSSDVIDAHVALLASHGDLVVSSDLDDLTALLRAARTRATLQRC